MTSKIRSVCTNGMYNYHSSGLIVPFFDMLHSCCIRSKSRCLCYRYAFQIVLQTRDLLRALPSLVDINIPDGKHFTVCGDVHGQVVIFSAVLNISEKVQNICLESNNAAEYLLPK